MEGESYRKGWESSSHCLIHAYWGHNVTVMQFVLGQKPSRTYLAVTGLICLLSPPPRPPWIKGVVFLFFFLSCSSPGWRMVALIRCDCMIMKLHSAMSKQLTQHKRVRLVKFLISSKCHEAHLGFKSQPVDRLVLHLDVSLSVSVQLLTCSPLSCLFMPYINFT